MPVHGKKTVFKLDNLANTLTDISAKCTNVDFPLDAEVTEVSGFGASSKVYIVGLKDSKISLQGNWDAAIDTQLFALLGAGEPTGQPANEGFDFEYGPEGSATGATKNTGKAILTKFQKTSPIGGKVSFSAELQVTGDVTRTTYP